MSQKIELKIELEGGRLETLVFRPVRMQMLLKAGTIANVMGKIWSAAQDGDNARALVVLMEALTDKLARETIFDLLLDSLRRDATEDGRKWVVENLDGPALLAALAGVVSVNFQRASPLLMVLAEGAAASLNAGRAGSSSSGD